ncbi:MAG TPA: DUF6544 family protein [Candidatus Limnocylindria bacterium]|nr:DUF6544 family protein [Candidatus Limnocylindria bacterium]
MDIELLPEPVRRYLDVGFGGSAPSPRTLVMEGTGRVRIGPLPWLPIEVQMNHEPGRNYVSLIRLRPGGVPVLRVVDAYVDGRGITKIGPFASVGEEVDQGAFLAMWAGAIGLPSAWADGVAWEAVDAQTARARLPFSRDAEVATVHFDPTSGFPVRFEADRYRTRGGPKIRWFGGSRAWQVAGGLPYPSRVDALWADEPAPWFEMRVERARIDVPVEAAMGVGRRAIAQAAGEERS